MVVIEMIGYSDIKSGLFLTGSLSKSPIVSLEPIDTVATLNVDCIMPPMRMDECADCGGPPSFFDGTKFPDGVTYSVRVVKETNDKGFGAAGSLSRLTRLTHPK